MEENSDIDKLARSAMDVFKKDVPEKAWKQLDADLDKRQALIYKKKANWFRLLSIGLALLLFFLIMYHYLVPSSELITMNYSGKEKVASASESVIPADKNIAGNNLPANEAKVSPDVNNKVLGNETAPNAETPKQELPAKNIATAPNDNHRKPEGHTVSRSESKPVLSKSNESARPKNKKKDNDQSRNTTVDSENRNNSSENDFNTVVNVKEVLPASNEAATTSTPETTTMPGGQETEDISVEPAKQFAALTPEPVEAVIHNENVAGNQPAVDSSTGKKRSISRFSVAAFYSPEHTWINLKDNNSSDDKGVSAYYGREKFESAYTAGLTLGYDLNDRWSIISGCMYSERKFSMTYSTIYVGYGFDGDLHYQYPTSWGIVEKPNTSNKVLHDGDVLNKTIACSQVIRFISVPLIVKYKIAGNRLEWFATTGVTANMLNHVFMDLTIGGNKTRIENNIDGLKKINYGYVAGTRVSLKLFSGFGIFTEPVFRGSLTSITKNISVDSYPWSLGLNAGIQYQPIR